MIIAGPGDPIWIPEGSFMSKDLESSIEEGLPIGWVTTKPFRAILIEKIHYNHDTYVKAYVDGIGERILRETSVRDMLI